MIVRRLCTSQLGTTRRAELAGVDRRPSARASVPARSEGDGLGTLRDAVRTPRNDGSPCGPSTMSGGGGRVLGVPPPHRLALHGSWDRLHGGTGTPVAGSSCLTRSTFRPNRVRVRVFRKGAQSVPDLGRICAGVVPKAGARSEAPGTDLPQHAVTKGDSALLPGGTGGTVDRFVGSRLPSTARLLTVRHMWRMYQGVHAMASGWLDTCKREVL
jgi:hypothetical protein